MSTLLGERVLIQPQIVPQCAPKSGKLFLAKYLFLSEDRNIQNLVLVGVLTKVGCIAICLCGPSQ